MMIETLQSADHKGGNIMKDALKYVVVAILAIGFYWVGSNVWAGYGLSEEEKAYQERYAEFYEELLVFEEQTVSLFSDTTIWPSDHVSRYNEIVKTLNNIAYMVEDLHPVPPRYQSYHKIMIEDLVLSIEAVDEGASDVKAREEYGLHQLDGYGAGTTGDYKLVLERFREHFVNIPKEPILEK